MQLTIYNIHFLLLGLYFTFTYIFNFLNQDIKMISFTVSIWIIFFFSVLIFTENNDKIFFLTHTHILNKGQGGKCR